jgi:DNA-binding winged helix-turn-helix (wHTH) protein
LKNAYFPDKMPADHRSIDWAPDQFDHEISTCVNVKGRGLLITTSCGHRGVVNSAIVLLGHDILLLYSPKVAAGSLCWYTASVVRAGPLSIDLVSRVVALKGKRIQLTRKEYAMLHGLATHVGLVVSHQQLIRDIWGAHAGNIQYLRILVRKLRQKIEADPTQPLLIVSESGVGYRLDQSEPGAAHRPSDISSDTCCA